MVLSATIMGYIALAGYKLFSYDKIPSTQTYALNMVASGTARNHTVIVAEAQSSGRGRYKRTWVSHHGNLYASFIYSSDDERDPRLSYVVAVAVAETLIYFGITPQIKWPNDILIDGNKVCGILIEYAGRFVIVGIGINIKNCPTIENYKTTCMNKYINVDKADVLNKLMVNLDKWRRAKFIDVRARWMELAAGLNSVVKYRGDIFELIGINENGALILRRGTQYMLAYGDEITM